MNHDEAGAAAPALPPDTPAPATPWAAFTAPPPAAPRWQPLAIEFTGSGSEYFRIWVVNMLLVIVTFSLYLPFAKARRLRYLHGNTLVGGQALGFHGQGSTMLRGYLLVLGFAGCYALAGHFSPLAAGLAGLALALLWPALWQASLRFRLANTSWRGIRLRFTGSVGDAYLALLPMLLPGALFLLLSGLRGMGDADADAPPAAVGRWAEGVVAVCVLLLMTASPWLTARLKRYQHGHYQFAGETTTLSARTGQFYGLSFRAGLMALGPMFLLGVGMAVLKPLELTGREPGLTPTMAVLVSLVLLFYGLLLCVVQPWWAGPSARPGVGQHRLAAAEVLVEPAGA